MKKSLFLLLLLLPFTMLNAQINLEKTYSHSGAYIQLANSGYKFYLMDVGNAQCRIYNMDHSLWKTINLNVPANNYLYDIRYVSENLFTNDNTLSLCYIYYYYDETNQYYTYTAKIIRENGTELLSIPGAQYVYVNNVGEEGTKLTAYSYDYSVFPSTIQTLIYDLPGELVSYGSEDMNPALQELAYPNPATDFTVIPYTLPDGAADGRLLLNDASGRLIKMYNVDQNFRNLQIDTRQLPKGVYFYHLESGNYTSDAGKFIVR